MAAQDVSAPEASPGEQTPLLGGSTRAGSVDDRSSETLTGRDQRAKHDGEEDLDRANQHVGWGRGWLIVLSLWGLVFLQASNMSGITTTQSKIAEDLDAYALASWFTSAYLIAASSVSPLVARLAQIFSPRHCIFVSSILFALGGLVTSQAPDLKVFLLGRAITGFGGAGIMNISFILVLELTAKRRRGLFVGLLNCGFTIGVSLGAVIAGALLSVTGWRFLFWIQTPFVLFCGLVIFFSIPKTFTSGHEGAGRGSITAKLAKIDYLGAATLTATICLFLLGLSWSKILIAPIIISFFLLVSFVLIELYIASDPIIPISVLKSRGALFSCVAQLGIMAARWMVLFYTPAYAIAVRGWSPASAGAILIPTNGGFALGGILAGAFHIRRTGSFWLPSLVCYSLFTCALFLLSQISNVSTPAPLYLLSVFFNGFCTGASLNYTLAHLLHLTPPSTHFITTSLLTTFRGFAGSFGSAIGGGLFVRLLKKGLETGFEENGGLEGREELVRKLLGSPALVNTLAGVERAVAVQSYVSGLKGLFLSGTVLAFGMILVQAGTGWKSGLHVEQEEGERTAASLGVQDEEWEEGMEQGV